MSKVLKVECEQCVIDCKVWGPAIAAANVHSLGALVVN